MNKKAVAYMMLVLLIFVCVVVVGYFALRRPVMTIPTGSLPTNVQTTTSPTGKVACQSLYDEIENDLNKGNYCQNNSDCDVLILGGDYIKFGCYHFINIKVDKNNFYRKMQTYSQRCTDIVNDCAPAPKPSCVANKCVYAE